MPRRMGPLEAARLALSSPGPVGRVLSAIGSGSLPPFVHVHVALVLLRKGLREVIESRGGTRITGVRRVDGDDNSLTSIWKGRDGTREVEVPIRLQLQEGLPAVAIVSVCTFADWKAAIDGTLEHLGPAVYQPFLRQWELQSVFGSLESRVSEDESIRLTRVSSLRRLLHKESRRRYESGVSWTDKAVSDAFEQAREEYTYFRSVSFELCKRDVASGRLSDTGVHGYVSRDGHLASTGRHSWVFEAAFAPLVERATSDRKLAVGRGRTERNELSRPIVATLLGDVAVSDDDVPRIAQKFRGMQRASVSILHGNPYLRASVVDLIDGSSFDVVLASDSRLLIVPQLRATEGAVTRLCRFIYDEIGEADFSEALGEHERT